MYVKEDEALEKEKELKVQIPVKHHLRLHTRKVLTGETISETVAQALIDYFEAIGAPSPEEAAFGDADDPDEED